MLLSRQDRRLERETIDDKKKILITLAAIEAKAVVTNANRNRNRNRFFGFENNADSSKFSSLIGFGFNT